ncbi:MAG: bifunctional metallophosphatase/5'-nucleotidase [Alistipes sp.]|nr:bifunctional metallophosphatase/5'-nucleotidase [Alistipes sp.]
MKKVFGLVVLVVITLLVARQCAPEQTLVILSTNDMHGKIQRMPELATAIRQCRDTAERVVLVDAGDRWTGNAYVDKVAVPGRPIIELMNRLGYDVATLGNHEFDHGQAHLGRVLDSLVGFEVVCANVVSDTCTFPQLKPWTILERGGVKIGVVGVITNYEGQGHPAGHATSYLGLSFPDPQQAARQAADELRSQVDVLVLLSHMGDDRDRELLASENRYDVLLGGHTHELIDTIIGTTPLGQTYKDLRNVGVTTIRLRGGKVRSVAYENRPITQFAPDSALRCEVARYYADEALNRPIGELTATATPYGLANWFVELAKEYTHAEVGFYHIGGIRLDSLAAGGVGTAAVFDLEPFSSRMATIRMTPAEMRAMILAKYNEQTREGHRYDLISTTPYRILTTASDEAVDVAFPTLHEGRSYKVVISDYAFKNYRAIDRSKGRIEPKLVTDMVLESLRRKPVTPDNNAYGEIVVKE